MSCFNFLYGYKSSKSSKSSKTNEPKLRKLEVTTLGFSGSNGPYYQIKNADIVSPIFETIKFIVKDDTTKEIKYSILFNCDDFDFVNEYPELEIKAHPSKYPYMCFYINDSLIYEQKHHIIVDIEITVNAESKLQDASQILDISEIQYCDN